MSRHPSTTHTASSSTARARQSIFSSAPAASTSSNNTVQFDAKGEVILTPAQQRAADKQAEHAAYLRLLKQVSSFDRHITELGQNIDLMGQGGKSFSAVLESWQNIFRATHVVMSELASQQAAGERLQNVPVVVRIPQSGGGAARLQTP